MSGSFPIRGPTRTPNTKTGDYMAKMKDKTAQAGKKTTQVLGNAAKILKKMEDKKGVDYGKVHIMDGSNIESVPTTSTGVLSLDLACGGGYPQGRLVEVSGDNATSKTTLTLHAIAAAQAAGGTCAFVDAEYTLDVMYAQKLGVNVPQMLLSQPDCGEQAFDVATGFAEQMSYGDIIVIDSVAALQPRVLLEGAIDDMSSAPGLHARLMARGVAALNKIVANTGVTVFFTNQMRATIQTGGYGPSKNTTGGNTLRFYASQRFEMRRGSQIKVGDEILGSEVIITVTKNKVAPPFRKAKTANIFGEGMAPHVDVLQMGLTAGLVKKSGAWFSYADKQLGQGFMKSAEFLKGNPEELETLRQHVLSLYGVTK